MIHGIPAPLLIYGVIALLVVVVGNIYLTVTHAPHDDRIFLLIGGTAWPLIAVATAVWGVGYGLLYWLPLRVQEWFEERRTPPAVFPKPEPPKRRHTEQCNATAIYGGRYDCEKSCPLETEPPEKNAGPYRGGACEKCGRPL